ncbi:Peptidase C12, ubiquitin carboxyl-terminal hydrolase 1 [Penicillium occitanis (nom. inval.)]|nr:Peptidase C12, ubiquitin carboxyl-terminal hydrolase 1 [Penicillium occitanis (nom. inval.)]PCH10169.1 hypothetical protein PENOC_004330 [Penicillium occitanis (nom. inval.)]
MTSTEPISETYDVVIVGGGPVGLLTAYQIARFGLSVCVLEKYDKQTQDAFGRAIALFPRTLEQLDQLDLIEPMLQKGFACRTSVTYKDGVQQSVGAVYRESTECTGFEIEDGVASPDAYPVKSFFTNNKTQEEIVLRSKYLVGADGGRSFVRRHAGIPFEGDTSEDKWIRIDGIVETDMPIKRAYGAIESKTHGNVLWAPLDHGATRIGYAFTPEIAAKYPGGVTEEVAVKEAIESMRPFNVKFTEVHWWTLYTIGQRIAKDFSTKDRIFLCGDAAHTHSSGAAQGLNTGIHDSVNLAWKLTSEIHGFTRPEVLQTYATERRTAVEKLINYDKDISLLMTHKWPSWYTGDRTADPYLVLGQIFEQAASFNTGLGINYPANVLNQFPAATSLKIEPGNRAIDVDLTLPGINRKVRFNEIARNLGKFWIVLFAGKIGSTKSSLLALRTYLAENDELYSHQAMKWLTISCDAGCSPYETLGMPPFGDTYYDIDGLAHDKYGIDPSVGGIMIIRPDGLVGTGFLKMPAPRPEIIDGVKTFIPLENNPDVLEILCENLQLSWDLAFHDIISTSPEFLQECYFRPCHALIVLADRPIYRAARSAVEPTISEYKGSGPGEPVIWMKQTIGHACGLMALLHVVFNLEGGRYVQPDTAMDALRQQAILLGPAERAQLLYDSNFLEEAHMDAASRGSSNVPSPRDDNRHHFLAFVHKDGKVWELNGGMKGPLLRGDLGEKEDLLSERGMELTVRDFLKAAEQTGCDEMSIVAVTGADAVAQQTE